MTKKIANKKTDVEKKKTFVYHVPSDAREIGGAAFVVWRNPKIENHIHITVPWEVSPSATSKERNILIRFGKVIEECVSAFMKSEKSNRDEKAKKTTSKKKGASK